MSQNFKILKMLGGTSIAQLIPIVISPLLTRLYTPEQFGIFGLYVLITAILVNFATLRYEMAITLPRYDKVSRTIVLVCLLLATLFSLILFLTLSIIQTYVPFFYALNVFNSYIFLLPVSVFLVCVYQILYYWFNRNGSYAINAISRVLVSGSMGISQLIFGTLGNLKVGGLLFGQLTGHFVAAFFLLYFLFAKYRFRLHSTLRQANLVLRRYANFPKYVVVASTLNILSRQSPVLFLTVYHSAVEAGFYILLQRTFAAPISVVGVAVADVFREEASNSFRTKGNCTLEVKNTLKKLFYLSILPFLLVGLFAPFLFSSVFGEQWATSGEYARILVPMFFLQFIGNPVAAMYMIANKQREDLLLQLFAVLGVTVIFTTLSDLQIVLLTFSAFYCVIYGWVIFRSLNISKATIE